MNLFSVLFSPITIIFTVIIVGFFIGRIKIFDISLDLAGILVVAVVLGCALSLMQDAIELINLTQLQSDMKFISSLGTALFVSAIGILAGSSLNIKNLIELKSGIIGSMMVFSAFITLWVVLFFDKNVSVSQLIGALCGAMTTTPGLSAVCELSGIKAEEAVIGYGTTYLIGAVFTLLFVQAASKEKNQNSENKDIIKKCATTKSPLSSVFQICLVVLIGSFFGNLNILGFCLGNSGGMLFVGICVGLVLKKDNYKQRVFMDSLELLRSFGLMLFFVGNGITAGVQISFGIEIKIIIYGAVITAVSISIGVILYRLLFKSSRALMTSPIAGGMTSTPAIAVLLQKNRGVSLIQYSVSYVTALLTIILCVRISELLFIFL